MTIAVSVLITLFGVEAYAAIGAGFIPASLSVALQAPHGIILLPFWLTPLTATLVHGGLLHLAFNMVMLVYCGRMLERALGWQAMALLYAIGAYAGAAGHWAFEPLSAAPMIGASGAISAILAAYAMLFAERPVPAIGPIPSRVVRVAWLAGGWILLQLLIGFASGGGLQPVAIGAHIGGFIAGLALARPLLLWRYRSA
ncbi:rhomboid family intramembrane serine protease [Sphingomonas sp. 28-63-12]|uniref:rhomboid family intramembrane serine protease n=1 Tax=Sphingomonas sp. 28-63-12 TaxID=1970434 RepID=UPI0035A95B54